MAGLSQKLGVGQLLEHDRRDVCPRDLRSWSHRRVAHSVAAFFGAVGEHGCTQHHKLEATLLQQLELFLFVLHLTGPKSFESCGTRAPAPPSTTMRRTPCFCMAAIVCRVARSSKSGGEAREVPFSPRRGAEHITESIGIRISRVNRRDRCRENHDSLAATSAYPTPRAE